MHNHEKIQSFLFFHKIEDILGTVQKDLKMTHSTFTNYATHRCPVNPHKARLAG
jgi:hypothetical protein